MPYKNKEKQKEACRRYKLNKLSLISKMKLERGCDLCGYKSHSAALQYHHKDPKTKTRDISKMAGRNYNIKVILKEIEKCSLLCANCHISLHSNEYFK